MTPGRINVLPGFEIVDIPRSTEQAIDKYRATLITQLMDLEGLVRHHKPIDLTLVNKLAADWNDLMGVK